MRWALLLLALMCGVGLLVLPAGASSSASGSVTISVDESVSSSDAGTPAGPAPVGSDEPVGTADAVAVSPPAAVPGDEGVTVSDDVSVVPPVTIIVDESVSPADEPAVTAPANVGAAETATTTDEVSVVPTTLATATTVSSGPNPALAGSPVTLQAFVTAGAGAVGSGTVTFEDGTAPLGAPVAVDAGGHASLTVSTLGLGTHAITAAYGGNAAYLASSGTTSEGIYDYTLSLAPPSQVVQRGDTAMYTLTSSLAAGSATAGLPATINLTTSAGATVAGPLALPGSTTLTVATGPSTPSGPQTVTVTGSPGPRLALASLYVNAPPVPNTGGPYTGNEGTTLTLHGSATDTAGETLTYSWDLGAGATATGASPSVALVDGPAATTVKLTVCDDHGACASATTTLTIANVAPTVSVVAPTDGSVIRARSHVTLSGSFTDPGVLDTHTAVWTVGGTTIPAAISEHGGNGTVTAVWTPAAAGFYPLSLTVKDKDGGTTTVSGGTLVVFDPDYSVSGAGGLIDVRRDLVLFAFEARYRDGESLPRGDVDLHVPHMLLDATRLDWLVVTSPSFALQGVARVNRVPGYRFRLDGTNGHPDQLRIRIWSPSGSLVYDSAVRGVEFGSIAIRR